jgi:uncharacterized protein YndB with AHSA1/START domain
MIVVWILLSVIGILALVLVALAVLGSRLPEEHTAAASVRIGKPPEAVWAVLADAASYPAWAGGVTKVERLPDRDGHEVWRQSMGRNSFVLETTRGEPPRVLERTIADEHGPFSGKWTYELRPDGGGTVVRLSEHGRIRSAIPRAVMRHAVGYHLYLSKHLRSLAAHFGETGEVFDKTVA